MSVTQQLPFPLRSARPWWPQPRHTRVTGSRVPGLDAARGLAVLGMVIAHSMLTPTWGSGPAALLGFVHGRSGILFATVAGVSLAIISGGSRKLGGDDLLRARATVLGRAVVLLLIAGALSMIPTTIQVILASYAFWFVLSLPALRWRPRTLLVVACCLALVGKLLVTGLPLWIPTWGYGSPDLGGNFVPTLLATTVSPALVWMAFVLAGMALGRFGLDNVRALRGFLVAGLVLFAGFAAPFVISAGSPAPLFNDIQRSATSTTGIDRTTDPATGIDWQRALWSFEPNSGTVFEVFSSGGLALALIAGLVLLGRLPGSRWVLLPLTGVGSMALTAYVIHVVVLSDAQPEGLVTDGGPGGWLCLGLVVACGAWSQVFVSGPLEQLTGAVADRLAGYPVPRSQAVGHQGATPQAGRARPDASPPRP